MTPSSRLHQQSPELDRPEPVPQLRRLEVSALIAAAAVLAVIVIAATTGWSAEHFQRVAPPEVFGADLARAAAPLRAIMSVDAVFIAAYTTLFALIFTLWRGRSPIAARIGLGFIILSAALDILENQLLVIAVDNAVAGRPVTADRVTLHVLISEIKFHSAYLGMALMGLVMPHRTTIERGLRASLIFVQLPLGALVFTVSGGVFGSIRMAFFLGGLLTMAWIAHQRAAAIAARP